MSKGFGLWYPTILDCYIQIFWETKVGKFISREHTNKIVYIETRIPSDIRATQRRKIDMKMLVRASTLKNKYENREGLTTYLKRIKS